MYNDWVLSALANSTQPENPPSMDRVRERVQVGCHGKRQKVGNRVT